MQISVVSRKFHVAIPKVKTSILFVIKATLTSSDDSTSPLRAKFHVPVLFHFKWVRNGHIGQKMGDVTRFMEGYFYGMWGAGLFQFPIFSLNLVSDKT